jgi:aminoglycoside 6'-N-acetyltransferase I
LKNLQIKPLIEGQAIPFELLQLADPSKVQIESYLKRGTCHIAQLATELVGVVVLTEVDSTTTEIKNIAVKETQQGKGFGKMLLNYSEKISRAAGYEKLIIGTGNSSIGQLALYQKAGFEMESIKKNFFIENYQEAIFENGIQCKHMVVLEKELEEKV